MTVENIIEYSKPHRNGIAGARQTRLGDDRIELSIVGGAQGLYGDFTDTFEVAIFDKITNEFITKFFFPDNNDDVYPYMEGTELVKFIEDTFPKGFQVR